LLVNNLAKKRRRLTKRYRFFILLIKIARAPVVFDATEYFSLYIKIRARPMPRGAYRVAKPATPRLKATSDKHSVAFLFFLII
jgi:hypothetical protein